MKKLGALMKEDVEVIHVDSSLRDAADKMRRTYVGALPVVDNSEHVIGMLTDRDIVVRGLAQNQDVEHTTVGDVMSRRVVFCYEDQRLDEAAAAMEREKVGRIVVVDRDQNLVGIVSLGDLTHELGKDRLAELVQERLKADRRMSIPRVSAIAGAGLMAASALWLGRKTEIGHRVTNRMGSRMRRTLPRSA